ncbi:MAG: DUF262 domain-containing protein [Candidatus Moranbacteria bacterium]|nr:DUF262 domain-containing protein [Candidatus Moranbacteria bacterium]
MRPREEKLKKYWWLIIDYSDAMKIDSKDFKIENIFSRRRYLIPDYQRNYSWTVLGEVSIFWDDFIYYLNKEGNENLFIGPMVFKGEGINATEFEVIDGQQRLITLSIFISVIVELLVKYERRDLADGLRQYLIYRDTKNKEQLVINTIEQHPFFQKRIFHLDVDEKPEKESEKLIEKARMFFYDSVEVLLLENTNKIEYLEKIRDAIFNIDTVIVVSNDETDAFTIFETINTRGKNLSSLDLLKNYIFKNYDNRTGVNEPKETWKTISDNIAFSRDSFFNRFWASWVSKVSEGKLYRRFSDYMRDENNEDSLVKPNNLLSRIFIASKIYRKITNPRLDDWSINRNYQIYYHIRNINRLFNLKIHFPFFLALFEEFENGTIDRNLMIDALVAMENFHFIFTHMVSPRASGLDNKYSKFAIRLRSEKNKKAVIEDLKKELTEKIPKFDEYREKFVKLNFNDNKDTIKFVLVRLEKEKDPSMSIDFELHSIEHLEPQSSGALFTIDSIGNLFLMEEKYNNDKDDKRPFEKLKNGDEAISFLIKNTKYKTTKQDLKRINQKVKWKDEDMKERADDLAHKTYNLFSKL